MSPACGFICLADLFNIEALSLHGTEDIDISMHICILYTP